MDHVTLLIPIFLLLGVIIAMMVTVLSFDQLKGHLLKDRLARLWPPDRRRVLFLLKQNGFHFFVERFIEWSDALVKKAWIFALPALAGELQTILIAAGLASFCSIIRSGTLIYLAKRKIAGFTLPLEYDGHGVYARSVSDWKKLKSRLQAPLIISSGLTALLISGAVAM